MAFTEVRRVKDSFEMLHSMLLLQTVIASTSYMFQWSHTDGKVTDCNFPPNLVYSFEVSDPLKTTRLPNETWPYFMNIWAPFYPAKACGSMTSGNMNGMCCTSILTPKSLSKGVTSVALVDTDTLPSNPQILFPKFMNGQSYCRLENLGSIFAYRELYIKTDGDCQDRVFRCFGNNTLRIYPALNCKGTPNIFVLNSTTSLQSHQYTSTFQASMVTVTASAGKIGYTEVVPSNLMVMSNLEPAEVIASIIYITLLVIEVAMVLYYCYRYYVTQRNSLLILIASHLSWLIFICLIMGYYYSQFSNARDQNRVMAAWGIFFGLGNLLTAIYSANFMSTIWGWNEDRASQVYAGVTITHFSLMGGYYLFGTMSSAGNTSWDSSLNTWNTSVYAAWTLLLFSWDMIPILAIIIRYSPSVKANWLKEAKLSFQRDLITAAIFFSQLLVAVFYLTVELLRGSSFWGNDRNMQASRSFSVCFVLLHCLLNTLIVNRVSQNALVMKATIRTQRSTRAFARLEESE